ncbi:hypothetical protein LXL04_011747 [Taraxacum kok-saghyz]
MILAPLRAYFSIIGLNIEAINDIISHLKRSLALIMLLDINWISIGSGWANQVLGHFFWNWNWWILGFRIWIWNWSHQFLNFWNWNWNWSELVGTGTVGIGWDLELELELVPGTWRVPDPKFSDLEPEPVRPDPKFSDLEPDPVRPVPVPEPPVPTSSSSSSRCLQFLPIPTKYENHDKTTHVTRCIDSCSTSIGVKVNADGSLNMFNACQCNNGRGIYMFKVEVFAVWCGAIYSQNCNPQCIYGLRFFKNSKRHQESSEPHYAVRFGSGDLCGCRAVYVRYHLPLKAEYRGVANTVAETSWLHNLLLVLHFSPSKATIVYCDNVTVFYISTNPVHHQCAKSIEVDIHFVLDNVAIAVSNDIHSIVFPYFAQWQKSHGKRINKWRSVLWVSIKWD